MKKTWKRIAAKILCLTLLLSQVPTVTYAEETNNEISDDNTLEYVAEEYAEEEDDIETNSDITEEKNDDVSDTEILYSGVSGDLEWKIDNKGKLTLSGSGNYVGTYDVTVGSTAIKAPEWCKYASNIYEVKFKDLDFSNITSMLGMFAGCYNLETLDLSSFDTSNVTDMLGMFYDCHNIKTLDLSSFDTSNVTNMLGMFYECYNLETLDLSSFDTSNVTNMESMFNGCSNLETLDLSSFNTSNVTNMNSMFYNCSELETLDLSSFNTSNVTNMNSMFWNCYNLETLDLSSFNTSNVTNMKDMFWDCSELETLDLSSFNTSNVTNMEDMFWDCSELETLDLSSFNTSNVTNMDSMFRSCSNLKTLDLSSFNTSNVTNMNSMFCHCSNLETLDLSSFNTSNVTNMDSMFYYCSNLTSSITISGTVSSYSSCFYLCSTEPSAKFEVKYDKNCSKELAQKIVDTKSADSNVYLVDSGTDPGGDEDNKENLGVRFFTKWDAEKQVAYFGDNALLGSKVTEKTDTSFESDIDNLVGKYVLACTKDRDDNMVDSDELISIKPVESVFGKVEEMNNSSVVLNGKSYDISPKCEIPEYTEFKDAKSIIHLYDNEVVGIEKLQAASGTVSSWDKDTGELNLTSKNGERTYKLSYFTDGENLTVPNSGKDVRVLCDNANLFYEAYEYQSDFVMGRDNFSFENSPEDFFDDEELKKWSKCTEQATRREYASEAKNEQDYSPIQITEKSYNRLVDGLDESLKEKLYDRTHYENWGGSCYGMSSVMAIRFIEESRLPIASIFPLATTTNSLPAPKDSEDVEDVVNFYQLLYSFPTIADGETQLEDDVKSNYSRAVGKLIDEIKKDDPVIVAILRKEDGKNTGAHAVVALGVQEETNDYYKIKVCDPNYSDSFKYLFIYKNKAVGIDGLNISYSGSETADKDTHTYNDLYNYVSGVETMDLKNYFDGVSKSKIVNKYDKPMLTVSSDTNVRIAVNDSQVDIKNATDLSENIYGPYPEMCDLTSEEHTTTNTYFLKNSLSDNKYRIEVEPESEFTEVRLILNNHSFSISSDSAVNIALDDKTGELCVDSEKEADISLKITSNEISDEWTYPTVAVDLEDTKDVTMQVTDKGVELSSDNLNNAQIATKNDDTIKSSEINTDKKEVTIVDSDGTDLDIKEKDSNQKVAGVTNLKATADGKNKVKLTWTASADADGYLVYGKRSSQGKYGYIGMTTKNTSYVDNKALDADYNFYWVYPYKLDSDGKKIINTSCKYVYAKGICAGVTDLKATAAGKNKVKLTWAASADADGYLIYGKPDSGKYGYIGMTSKTAYTDTKAADHEYNFYWVYPYMIDSAGERVINTSCKYIYAKGVCTAVTNLKATNQKGSVKLTWTKSQDADGYLIYGKTASGTYGYIGMTNSTSYIDKKASKTEWNFYWIFPYHNTEYDQKMVGLTGKYVYGKAK